VERPFEGIEFAIEISSMPPRAIQLEKNSAKWECSMGTTLAAADKIDPKGN
jgi:hypothetical protein